MKRISAMLALAALAAILLPGCRTSSTIHEFDESGNLVRTTFTERDPFDKITDSTKDKTVVMWSNGWAAYASVSTATTEDPTPTGKLFAGKVAKGYISILPGQQSIGAIAKIIAATREDLTLTADKITTEAE